MKTAGPHTPLNGQTPRLMRRTLCASETSPSAAVGSPLFARDQTVYTPSGSVTAKRVKVVFTIAGWARVSSSTGEVLLESGTILTIPAGLEYRGYPAGYTRTVTLYIHPEYLTDQLRWLSITHPLIHHLNRALSREVQLQHLQVAAPVMRHLTPSLAWLAQHSSCTSL